MQTVLAVVVGVVLTVVGRLAIYIYIDPMAVSSSPAEYLPHIHDTAVSIIGVVAGIAMATMWSSSKTS